MRYPKVGTEDKVVQGRSAGFQGYAEVLCTCAWMYLYHETACEAGTGAVPR